MSRCAWRPDNAFPRRRGYAALTGPHAASRRFDAEDVRDVGIRGRTDAEVFQFALAHQRAVITADLGFADVRTYPLGSHDGIVVARFPNEIPIVDLNAALMKALAGFSENDLRGALVIVEPHRIRIRRLP